MGLTIYQVNIKNFLKLKYSLSIDLSNFNADIVFLNETSSVNHNQLKLTGYKSIGIKNIPYHGMAIFIKLNINVEYLHFPNEDLLAIKVQTNLGPIILATTYAPPRNYTIPLLSLNKLFSFNMPVLLIGDMNARHHILNNMKPGSSCNPKGHQMHNLIKGLKLNVLGPHFTTYVGTNRQGTPDIIVANNLFSIFNYDIKKGNDIGSDHRAIVFTFQIQPFIKIKPISANLKTLNISKYKEEMSELATRSLQGLAASELDTETGNLLTAMQNATSSCCKHIQTTFLRTYKPTNEINNSFAQLQIISSQFYNYGMHNLEILNTKITEILEMVTLNQGENWENLGKLAYECHGNVEKFWERINRMRGGKTHEVKYLKRITVNEDSEDDENYGDREIEIISNPKEQANYMSEIWQGVFQENKTSNINNKNIKQVEEWYDNHKDIMIPDNTINFDKYPLDHPILRPISITELNNAIKNTRNKAPGPSGLRIIQFKYLPLNCKNMLVNIYNGITVTKFFPQCLELIDMIFIKKPSKDPTNPKHYRPISLMEVALKLYERIISQRLQYFLEYHNLYSEKQFGFRQNRSTQHAIALADIAIESHKATKKTILIASRDTSKAFDCVWQIAMLQKIANLPTMDFDFVTLIKQFLDFRKIRPKFNGEVGNLIYPKAGISQGSSLGPLLFIIYVNDHPTPVFKDTLTFQFADDLTHIVCSDGQGPSRRTKQALTKLKYELEATAQWEEDWKIKCNPDKSTIQAIGTSTAAINKYGGIQINNQNIPIINSTKLLGATITKNKSSRALIINNITKAKISLQKLWRFKEAPSKIKITLVKALIIPLLEYPSITLRNVSLQNKRKLQAIQNKALRFVFNIKLSDKKRVTEMHNEANMEPLNVRIDRQYHKILNKMKQEYYVTKDQTKEINYKYSDYTINQPTLRTRRRTIAQRIRKYITGPNFHKDIIKDITPMERWKPPDPIYLAHHQPNDKQ